MTHPSTSPEPADRAILARYILGLSTTDETVRVEFLLATSSAERAFVEGVRFALPPMERKPQDEARAAFQRFQQRLAGPQTPPRPCHASSHAASHIVHRRQTRRGTPFGGRGRILLGAAVTATVIAWVLAGPSTSRWIARDGQASRTERVVVTQRAERVEVTLPDGSRATLAPETRLAYRIDAHGTRLVQLDGEARFTVQHDPDIPFVVRAGTIDTRVLGTTFSVRHYPEDHTVRVAVVDGRVTARGRSAPLLLTAGMGGDITDSTATRLSKAQTEALTAWEDDRLVFHDTQVAEVLAMVGRWYGYQFHLADSALASRNVTVTLVISKPSESLRLLQDLLDVDMTVDGNRITLRRQAKRPATSTPSRAPRGALLPTLTEVGR